LLVRIDRFFYFVSVWKRVIVVMFLKVMRFGFFLEFHVKLKIKGKKIRYKFKKFNTFLGIWKYLSIIIFKSFSESLYKKTFVCLQFLLKKFVLFENFILQHIWCFYPKIVLEILSVIEAKVKKILECWVKKKYRII